jgi:outer membrane protein assembly factor BamB
MNRIRSGAWIATAVLVGVLFRLVPYVSLASDGTTGSEAAYWAQWRGPSGQGYSDDKQVPLEWNSEHNLLWKAKLPGKGNSSPIVWGDRIFLTASSHDGKERYVLCAQATNGKILWQHLAAREDNPGKTHDWNGHASASCATDGKHVYAFFGTPGLFCYNFDGKLIWKHAFGVFTSEAGWGAAASPFLYEDLVIQNCDNDGSAGLPAGKSTQAAAPMSVIALEKTTGKVRWQAPRNQGRGFSTPILIRSPQGRQELVLNGPHGVWAYNPRTGEELWHCQRHKGDDSALFGEPIPAYSSETLFALSGRPGPMQAIHIGGSGDVTSSHLAWEVVRKGSRDVASPMLWKDVVYVADRYGMITGYDINTGKQLFKERAANKPFVGSPVAVRGRILFLLEDGTTFVLEPGHRLNIVRRNQLDDGTEFRASPAVVDGRLYLRSQSHLYCIGEKKERAARAQDTRSQATPR